MSESSAFSTYSLYIWMFLVQVLLKKFEHYLASMWNECNCVVVWTFVGIALLWNWNELAPRPGPTNQAPVPSAKQLTGWEHNPTHQQTGCLRTSWAHSHLHTPPLTWPCLLEAQDPAPFTSGQAPAPPTRKPAQVSGPVTPTTRSKKNYDPAACRTESTNAGQNLPWDQLIPGPWVMRSDKYEVPHRGHFSKVNKHK